ncbi:hypothetical protein KOR42_39040 [Thalassoglobus neptunius]|uniref:Uncharacterized protein n=1 Tax=Thalassoglobus neptunius TaxID=1938619 RepID=A0A5C5WIJ5_9PLAN|nr:hypothetical protein KOR42_39040 [Thalassoglobus neptunius]
MTGYPWIETLAEMGHINPFFERAGFLRIGTSQPGPRSRTSHSTLYGSRKRHGQEKSLLTKETFEKSRFANPIYYIFDNREHFQKEAASSTEREERNAQSRDS